jgi:hypothetical protein
VLYKTSWIRGFALPSRVDQTARASAAAGTTQQIAETSQAVGGLVSDRLEFDIVCPHNHNQTVTFSQEEFEEALKSGALVFHCNTCETDWPPSSEEIAKLRKQFSKNPS